MVYANFALKIVISASFMIKEVHTSVLVRLAHAVPLHTDGLSVFDIYTVHGTPGTECGHLLQDVSDRSPRSFHMFMRNRSLMLSVNAFLA